MNDDDDEEDEDEDLSCSSGDHEALHEEESEWTPTHPDIDRGWAYVVLFACFCLFCGQSGMQSKKLFKKIKFI